MSASTASKAAGLLIFLAASTTVFGQQKPSNQNEKKPADKKQELLPVVNKFEKDTTLTFTNIPVYNDAGKKIGVKDSTVTIKQKDVKRYKENLSKGVTAPAKTAVTTKKVAVQKEIKNPEREKAEKEAAIRYKALTPEQRREQDLNWITNEKARKDYAKRVPNTITVIDSVEVPVEQPVALPPVEQIKSTQEQDSSTYNKDTHVRETIFMKKPGTLFIAGGLIQNHLIDNEFDDFGKPMNGYWAQIEYEFPNEWTSVRLFAAKYNGGPGKTLIADERNNDGALYDIELPDVGQLRNEISLAGEVGHRFKMFNEVLQFHPYVAAGVKAIPAVDYNVKGGYELTDPQKKEFDSKLLGFAEGGVEIYGFITKNLFVMVAASYTKSQSDEIARRPHDFLPVEGNAIKLGNENFKVYGGIGVKLFGNKKQQKPDVK